jgi:uncharacterized protein YdiU (UPF0061 family)
VSTKSSEGLEFLCQLPDNKTVSREIIHAPYILELGRAFYDPVRPATFPKLELRYRNNSAAATIGLDALSEAAWKRHFGQFQPFPGNLQEPLALRYHGHQFRHYNPDLGDGRGFLFAQFQADGILYDLGTKGSGQTPYSRNGDGRLTLKGAVREALATELLETLGVNTSKTLSIFETGEQLVRQDEPSPTRAAVLVRLSEGHIRIGTFQRLAYLNETENIKKLTTYCLKHYYPASSVAADESTAAAVFFKAVTAKCAALSAQWMIAGFVHGVLNSDNINISGESFDYGPYRFLPTYDPLFTAAYFDERGLYSFGRQPVTMVWNLEQLGKSLLKAFPDLPVEEILNGFSETFNTAVKEFFFRRLNLVETHSEADDTLLMHFFRFLEAKAPLFEQTFFDFFGGYTPDRLQHSPQKEKYQGPEFENLLQALQAYPAKDPAKNQLEYFRNERPCTLLIDEIEEIWAPIASRDDWSLFESKIQDIRQLRGLYQMT